MFGVNFMIGGVVKNSQAELSMSKITDLLLVVANDNEL